MVKHFNKDSGNDVRYWMVGNEPDLAGLSAATYSTNFNRDYDAMKAIDPTISIGGGATAWYDAPFLQTFLQQSGGRVDFVDFHGYAQEGNAPGDYTTLFHIATGYGDSITNLRSLIQHIVPARASHIGIEVGEWELNWGGTAQNNTNFHAVWAASALGHILSAGGWSLFFADKGNAIYSYQHTVVDPHGHVVNIRAGDTNPAYHGIGMFTGEGLFRGFGDTMVHTHTTLPNVEVYASDNPKNIVALNKDPSITQTTTVHLKGVTSGAIDVWRKDESVLFPNPPIKRGTLPLENGTFTSQLPPFSVTAFVLHTASQASPTPSPPAAAAPSPTPSFSPGTTLAQDTFRRANATTVGAVLRWTDGNNWYKAYIDGANLVIQKKVNGTTTVLHQIPFASQAGTSYTLRFNVVGSTLSAKVWQMGSPEPGAWMLTAADSTFQSGRCGLRTLVQRRLGFASILSPQPVVALAIRIVKRDSGKIILLFIRVDEIVQATPLPEVRLILQVIAQHIGIFRQVVTNPSLYSWAQERREMSARGPAQ